MFCAPGAWAQTTSRDPRAVPYAKVVPGYTMRFPYDEGSHPDFRIEWWYVTGWLDPETNPLGFQVTFFRVRPELKHDNPSRFSPRQILIAHAAVSDPAHGRLIHAQRTARGAFGLAGAAGGRVETWVDDWRLARDGATYRARVPAPAFTLDLAFDATQAPLLQGRGGYSRKGAAPDAASYYYSHPQLTVDGTLARDGKRRTVRGVAWLDHEWSSQYMQKDAVGWDWIGINLDDGGALMAFRMRGPDGRSVWAGATWRQADGSVQTFEPDAVRFVPRREWRSAHTGTRYPVAWTVEAGNREIEIEPLFDDQEHDARASTGTIYWDGAVRALSGGKPAGLGYLELTGYWRRVSL